jgi:hypothetical protein
MKSNRVDSSASPKLIHRDSTSSTIGDVSTDSAITTTSAEDAETSSPAMEEKRRKHLENRSFVVHEIAETEQRYCENLQILIDKFKSPFEEQKIVPGVFVRIVFTGIQALLDFSHGFSQKLTALVDNWDDEISQLSPLFLEHREDFHVFLKFVDNYSNALAMIRRAEESNQAFKQFNEKCKHNRETQRQQLQDFLILPIQRATRYPLLLKDVRKHTPDDHPDFPGLSESLELMNQIAAQVNQVKQQEEEMTRMFTMFKLVEACPPNVIKYTRRVILETDVTDAKGGIVGTLGAVVAAATSGSVEKPTTRLYLLSDLLLLAKMQKKKLKFLRLLDLADIDVVASENGNMVTVEVLSDTLSAISATLVTKHTGPGGPLLSAHGPETPSGPLPGTYTFVFPDSKAKQSFVLAIMSKIRVTKEQRDSEGSVFSLPRGMMSTDGTIGRGSHPHTTSLSPTGSPNLPISITIPSNLAAPHTPSDSLVTTPVSRSPRNSMISTGNTMTSGVFNLNRNTDNEDVSSTMALPSVPTLPLPLPRADENGVKVLMGAPPPSLMMLPTHGSSPRVQDLEDGGFDRSLTDSSPANDDTDEVLTSTRSRLSTIAQFGRSAPPSPEEDYAGPTSDSKQEFGRLMGGISDNFQSPNSSLAASPASSNDEFRAPSKQGFLFKRTPSLRNITLSESNLSAVRKILFSEEDIGDGEEVPEIHPSTGVTVSSPVSRAPSSNSINACITFPLEIDDEGEEKQSSGEEDESSTSTSASGAFASVMSSAFGLIRRTSSPVNSPNGKGRAASPVVGKAGKKGSRLKSSSPSTHRRGNSDVTNLATTEASELSMEADSKDSVAPARKIYWSSLTGVLRGNRNPPTE